MFIVFKGECMVLIITAGQLAFLSGMCGQVLSTNWGKKTWGLFPSQKRCPLRCPCCSQPTWDPSRRVADLDDLDDLDVDFSNCSTGMCLLYMAEWNKMDQAAQQKSPFAQYLRYSLDPPIAHQTWYIDIPHHNLIVVYPFFIGTWRVSRCQDVPCFSALWRHVETPWRDTSKHHWRKVVAVQQQKNEALSGKIEGTCYDF